MELSLEYNHEVESTGIPKFADCMQQVVCVTL